MRGKKIELTAVSKLWGDAVALSDVNLRVAPGEFTVLLGPSGCGKSTTLRIIAGLESASSGTVTIGDHDVSQLPPSRRDIAMVFQSYALFPHLNVAENILFGLKVRGIARHERNDRLRQTADLLGLTPYLARKPSQLSGGQQQRVALGRAIIAQKPICLMDEPLSNLDAKLRNAMRTEIRDLQQQLGFSMVYVTHDQAEAITMADQVALMENGVIAQAGTPRQIYEQPATMFVAEFIGTPPMNLIPLQAIAGAATPAVARQYQPEPVLSGERRAADVVLGVRPECINITTDTPGVTARVSGIEYLGADLLVDCRIGESALVARVPGSTVLPADASVQLNWHPGQTIQFDSRSGQRLKAS